MHSHLQRSHTSFSRRSVFRSRRFFIFFSFLFSFAVFSTINPYMENRISKLRAFEEEFIKSDFLISGMKTHRKRFSLCSTPKKTNIDHTDKPEIRGNVSAFNAIIGKRVSNISNQIQRKSNQSFNLHLLVFGGCNPDETRRILTLISTANYENDVVDLTVVLSCSETLHQLSHFKWAHGSFRFIRTPSESSMDSLQYWSPQHDNELLFLISSTTVLSSDFYSALKSTIFAITEELKLAIEPKTPLSNSIYRNSSERTASNSTVFNSTTEQNRHIFFRSSIFGLSFDIASVYENLRLMDHGNKKVRNKHIASDNDKPFLSLSVAPTCQVVFSDVWRRFWKWHVLTQFGKDKQEIRREPDALDFSGACKSDWRNSFLTFLTEKNIFNLHGNFNSTNISFCKSGTSPNSGVEHNTDKNGLMETTSGVHNASMINHFKTALQRLPELYRHDTCGRKLKKGLLAKNIKQLKFLLQSVHARGSVIGVMVSPAFNEMLFNWLCYVKERGITNYFFITQSRLQARQLSSNGYFVFIPPSKNASDQSQENPSFNYGSVQYKSFISARTHFIGQILHLGYKVLLADVDSVWLSNPFPHMRDKDVDVFAQLEHTGTPCGGFLYLLPTRNMIRLWDYIDNKFQNHITWMVNHPSRFNATAYRKFVNAQQHVHEQRYLRESLKLNLFDVKLKGLDPLLFINGRDYFTRKKSIRAHITPIMIHNNYIIGRENKTRRFRNNGMWRLDVSGSCKCLEIRC